MNNLDTGDVIALALVAVVAVAVLVGAPEAVFYSVFIAMLFAIALR